MTSFFSKTTNISVSETKSLALIHTAIHLLKILHSFNLGFVNSNESLPIHFDLDDPPAYMNIDRNLHSYGDFVPREFVLYCKKIGSAKEGATTFVESTNAVSSASPSEPSSWPKDRWMQFFPTQQGPLPSDTSHHQRSGPRQ